MSAREMTSERLAWHRERAEKLAHAFGDDGSAELLAHIDALTVDRDEARQEVAALRAQRTWAMEGRRVEVEARERDTAQEALGWLRKMARPGFDDGASPLARLLRIEGAIHSTAAYLAEARRSDAEAKLAALVEAADLVVATAERQGEFDGCPIEAIASALRAVRGET